MDYVQLGKHFVSRHLPSPSLLRCCSIAAELLQPHALIAKLSAMAPEPDAASNAAKTKEMTKKKGLASLVKVEGVCAECEFSLVFHMPKDGVQR